VGTGGKLASFRALKKAESEGTLLSRQHAAQEGGGTVEAADLGTKALGFGGWSCSPSPAALVGGVLCSTLVEACRAGKKNTIKGAGDAARAVLTVMAVRARRSCSRAARARSARGRTP